MKFKLSKLPLMIMGIGCILIGTTASIMTITGVVSSPGINMQITIFMLIGITIVMVDTRLSVIEKHIDRLNRKSENDSIGIKE